MKAGTTSLYDFIIKHPTIVPASRKELHYFSCYYKYGDLWYRSNFPTKASKYHFYKKTGQKLLSGEATPGYLFFPVSPVRMKKILPNVKLIVILRNPVDRAYSHYHYTIRNRKFHEPLSFEKAIELEKQRAREREQLINDPNFVPSYGKNAAYLARGVYVDQLKNWFQYYDKKQFLILTAEDLRKDPQRTLDQVFDFLEVSPFQVKNLQNLNVGSYKEMNKDTRNILIEYFKLHNERLSKLLQRSFDWDK